MARIPEETRKVLRKPLGALFKSIADIKGLESRRIISVGDICTISLIKAGFRPHLAVFDFRHMRSDLGKEEKEFLMREYPDPKKYRNPAGFLSDEIMKDAPALLRQGGAVLIKGEEDLTAVAFILAAGQGDVVVYGQPDEGVVVVRPDETLKRKVKEIVGRKTRPWHLSAPGFGHEVE